MVRRSTWILLVVFVILLGTLLIFQNKQDTSLGDEVAGELGNISDLQPAKPLFQVPVGKTILGLKVIDSNENYIEVIRESELAEWELITPDDKADQEGINRVITQLEAVTVDQTLDPDIDLEAIGLTEPSYTIRLLISNGGYFTIYVGDVTITKTSYYAQLKGQKPVIISKYDLDSAINLLTSPPIALDPTPTLEP